MFARRSLSRTTLLVRVTRNLTPEEVYERIRKLEDQSGLTSKEFEDLLLRGKKRKQSLNVYIEWRGLVDAFRGYEEGGELDYSIEETRDLDARQLARLTPKRLELLSYLANRRVDSINELAHRVRRDVKNVYEDLLALRRLNLLQLKKRGKRNIAPKTNVKEIAFLIR